ncbi:hypothetical protein LCGC14_1012870 [marine sediment metagenome]|uniref:Cupin 2 conserved barrel domain-containing protein n=1 Tax=marine sediment metagenome TaxID=412755 RepID=A0A0F9R5V7_9ZZZZ
MVVKNVEKVWGREEWLVNEPEYCAKYLYVNQGACCSMHCHPRKKETFCWVKGDLTVEIDRIPYALTKGIEPLTIMPGINHQFYGKGEENVILEVSTHHEDSDVVRLNESKSG